MAVASLVNAVCFARGTAPKFAELQNAPSNKVIDDGLICVYGLRDAIEDLARWRREAESKNMEFCDVEIKVDVGNVTKPINLGNLEEARLLNFRRVELDVETVIINKWKGYLAEYNMRVPDDYFMHKNYVASNPDFLSRLHKEPEFNHLDVFIYPVKHDDGITRYKSVLMRTDNVLEIKVLGNLKSEIEVTLPKLGNQNRLKMS